MNYGYQYNPQPNIDRINSQIGELEKLKAQMTQPHPTNLTQNFQITPNGSQGGFRLVNNVDDVKREIVIMNTIFLSNDYKNMWIKDVNGNIRPFNIKEIVPKDEKDLIIEDLQRQINELKGSVRNEQPDENDGKSVVTTEPRDAISNQ